MSSRISSRGFTLIELLVVIAIIGLLSSIVLAAMNTARKQSRDAHRAGEIDSTIKALELYALDNAGAYPATQAVSGDNNCAGNGSCLGDLKSVLVTTGKYLPSIPVDPTYTNSGNNYRYCAANATNCRLGANKCYTLLRRDEAANAWCVPQSLPSPPTGSACWFTNGVPNYPYC